MVFQIGSRCNLVEEKWKISITKHKETECWKWEAEKKRKMRATTTNKSIRSISEVYMMVCVLEVYNITSFEKKKWKAQEKRTNTKGNRTRAHTYTK